MAKSYSHVTHVIFDLDGTIIDSETIYNEIYVKLAEKYGQTLTAEDRLSLAGTVELDVGRWMVERFTLPITAQEFDQQVKIQVKEKLKKPSLKPGAEKLIRHLKKHSVPMCVASSSGEESFRIKTSAYSDLFDLFDHVVLASSDPEVVHGKPAPDVFQVAANRFSEPPDPKKCLVLEDSPNGVRGAISAGMQVVMIPEDYCTEENTKEATLVIQSLDEFDPKLFGLPGYNDEKDKQPKTHQKSGPRSSKMEKSAPKSGSKSSGPRSSAKEKSAPKSTPKQ